MIRTLPSRFCLSAWSMRGILWVNFRLMHAPPMKERSVVLYWMALSSQSHAFKIMFQGFLCNYGMHKKRETKPETARGEERNFNHLNITASTWKKNIHNSRGKNLKEHFLSPKVYETRHSRRMKNWLEEIFFVEMLFIASLNVNTLIYVPTYFRDRISLLLMIVIKVSSNYIKWKTHISLLFIWII